MPVHPRVSFSTHDDVSLLARDGGNNSLADLSLGVASGLAASTMHYSSTLWLQVLRLFPTAKGLEVTWHSIVKIGQSLYNEGPGMDPFRPDQQTPVKRMFLAGSYTKQDYIDSM